MINRTQITVSSSFFKANTTEDFTHEDNPSVADKGVDERLNTFHILALVVQVDCASVCCLLPPCCIHYVNVIGG